MSLGISNIVIARLVHPNRSPYTIACPLPPPIPPTPPIPHLQLRVEQRQMASRNSFSLSVTLL